MFWNIFYYDIRSKYRIFEARKMHTAYSLLHSIQRVIGYNYLTFLQLLNSVTESTIIATIHCLDVGYCLFRNPLVTHIPYHLPSLLLQFPIGYYFLSQLISSPRSLVPNQDTLRFLLCITGLVHQQRSLACLIPLLVLLVISCRLYTYVLGLSCFATLVALHFDIVGQDTWLCFICI